RSFPSQRWADERDAVSEFSTAVSLAPMDWRRHLQRLEALMQAGQLREAERVIDGIITLNPGHGRAYELYTEILETRGEFAEARRFYAFAQPRPGVHWSQDRATDLAKKARAKAKAESDKRILP